MLLRRIIEHVRAQNWTAIVLDFVIVVVGVFIGIEVSNWNESLAFERRERALLVELRGEVAQNMADAQAKGEGFLVGAGSARRILDAIHDESQRCTDDCWDMTVDLMHASQWQQIMSSWTTYDELRRDGLPSDRRLIEMIEKYKVYSHQVDQALSIRPRYRTLVRGLIPIQFQDDYWDHCYSLDNAIEVYLYPCPSTGGVTIDAATIDAILANPDVASSLREWTSIARVVGETLTGPQQALGHDILQRIDGTGSGKTGTVY
ncbi:MAG: hypothetical protein V2I25_00240 [Woeseiaceae bacterium]|nr:hypothetical protein [Woeseiaceae bacterium]